LSANEADERIDGFGIGFGIGFGLGADMLIVEKKTWVSAHELAHLSFVDGVDGRNRRWWWKEVGYLYSCAARMQQTVQEVTIYHSSTEMYILDLIRLLYPLFRFSSAIILKNDILWH
jgi:hypothetical protein